MPRNLRTRQSSEKRTLITFSSTYDYSFLYLRNHKAMLTATRFATFPVSADHLLLPQEKSGGFSALVTPHLRSNCVELIQMEVSSCTKQSLASRLDWKRNPRLHDKHGVLYFLLHQGIHSWMCELSVLGWWAVHLSPSFEQTSLVLAQSAVTVWLSSYRGGREGSLGHWRTHKTELDHYVYFLTQDMQRVFR